MSEKRDKRAKSLKQQCKSTLKPLREIKQMILIVEEDSIPNFIVFLDQPNFIVKGLKLNFLLSLREGK